MLTPKTIVVSVTLAALTVGGLLAPSAQAQVVVNRPNPFWTPQTIVNAQIQQFLAGYAINRALTNRFAAQPVRPFYGPYGTQSLTSFNNSGSPFLAPGMNWNSINPVATLPQSPYLNANPLASVTSIQNPYGFGNPMGYSPIGFATPYGFGSPYGGAIASPYSAGGGAMYASAGFSNPYSSAGLNPYASLGGYGGGGFSYGGIGYGGAAAMQSQGQLMINSEMARSMRETAEQAKVKTDKDKFEFEQYKQKNTPTFTEQQRKIAQATLERIRTSATMSEILSGKALNLLLNDIGAHADRKVGANSLQLDEEVLKHLNVTVPNGGNLALLRNEGRLTWPVGIAEAVPADTRKRVGEIANAVYLQALVNKVGPEALRDLRAEVDKIGETLRSKVNDIPVGQYLEGKRFLNDFQDAIRALSVPNLVPKVLDFQRFTAGGKTSQELADYMLAKGLVFAPSTTGDEGAYQATHTALAHLDIAVNALQTAAR